MIMAWLLHKKTQNKRYLKFWTERRDAVSAAAFLKMSSNTMETEQVLHFCAFSHTVINSWSRQEHYHSFGCLSGQKAFKQCVSVCGGKAGMLTCIHPKLFLRLCVSVHMSPNVNVCVRSCVCVSTPVSLWLFLCLCLCVAGLATSSWCSWLHASVCVCVCVLVLHHSLYNCTGLHLVEHTLSMDCSTTQLLSPVTSFLTVHKHTHTYTHRWTHTFIRSQYE